ncbi:STAS/SEC14 domain-containing protein [Billgrantia desiderata]|uniref:STAS/SEC14 domain-containing protein n=1 Tax=Billgrantia desiderata TaxID=52021 RepID=A0AAW4YW49_9GAMM|nr:STAS/SEC14 domain-containing protein [Halomonas desiderata]MCE8010332.1 STAS/SEC14 domain-containing protein [Halomonas desiderata]MCE8031469.1 STAS/SEC14 domain-containing protein [Halomonas desiderata]MCE8043645.1 STAS/SEC14 domain-containing protein [Halomonas desiderata]MCE8048219.1 STAS/SEC14 domain-containing protein [Halomonas desiderata]MCE8052246.1 STAS/SEC14 domain-containing protein [Halomonas desiderata]
MIETLPAPEYVAAFRISGTLHSKDYDILIPAIESKLEHNEQIGVLADMTEFDHMTPGALLRDLSYALSKLGEYHRFKRAAVIADKRWIETTTKLADKLFPHTEMRVFHHGELEEAMRWVAGFRSDLMRGRL